MEKQGVVNLNVNAVQSSKVATKIQFSSLDTNSAKLIFNVTKDGAPLPLSAARAILDLRMADWSTFSNLPVKIKDAAKGVMEYSLTNEQLKHTGMAQAELSVVYENGQSMSISKFEFKIDKALRDQDVVVKAQHYIKDVEDIVRIIEEKSEAISDLDIVRIDEKLTELEGKVGEGGAGVDQQARQEIEGLTEQLADTEKFAIDTVHHLKPTALNLTDTGTTTIRLREMGKDGIVYAVDGKDIKKYDDIKNTWSTVLTAPLSPNFILSLDNGELLFATSPNDGVNKSTMYVTENKQKSFRQVFQASNVGNCYFHNNWGKSTHGNIVVVSEYGNRGLAVGVYLSTDYGKTFKMVFDIREHSPAPNDAHVHGSAYDPYWNRIWVVNGDLSNSSMYWSDDLGTTWKTVGNPFNQILNIKPMRNCVLFGADSVPYAIYRMDRESKDTMPKLKIAHIYAEDTVGELSYLPKAFHQRDEDSPVIINFCPENPELVGTYPNVWAMATYDGINYYEIFRDTVTKIDDISMLCYFPTKNNKAVVTTSREKIWVGNPPSWNKSDSYKTPNEVTLKALDDLYVNVRDFGVRSVNEAPLNFGNTKAMNHALQYCADNHKILYIPKDMEVTVGDITLENKNNFGIKVDGKLKAKAITGLKGIVFKNCRDIRIFDVNATYETYPTPYRDTQSILRFEQCSNIHFDKIICDNTYGNIVDFVNCRDIFGKLIKGVGKDAGTGSNLVKLTDCENVFIDEVIGENVGTDNFIGGIMITTASNTSVVRNINFKNIIINNHSTRALSLDNAKLGTMENVSLGKVQITKKQSAASTIYPVYLIGCKNISGDIIVRGQAEGINGLFIDGNVEGLNVNLDISNVRQGIYQVKQLSKSKITGKINNCTYRALSLEDMTDVIFEVEIGEVTGNQYSAVISYSKTRTNVLFNRCVLRKGANTTGAVDIGGTNTNVVFKGCDLSEWGTEIAKMIKCGSTATIKREECLGLNYLSAAPTAGKWNVGEVVWNTAPSAGGYMGWICTVAGVPGTWKGFGAIQA